jgi:hypothetical protein
LRRRRAREQPVKFVSVPIKTLPVKNRPSK